MAKDGLGGGYQCNESTKVIIERKNPNKELLRKLSALIELNPNQRFGQILINYFFFEEGNIFFEESEVTLLNFNKYNKG